MAGNKHSALMAKYAAEAVDCENPFENWEFRGLSEQWQPLADHPAWSSAHEYRRRPQVVVVDGVNVPAPYKGKMKEGDIYYTPNPFEPEGFSDLSWYGNERELHAKCRGMVHLNKASAILHCRALVAASGGVWQ
jgi:hypothetical protein